MQAPSGGRPPPRLRDRYPAGTPPAPAARGYQAIAAAFGDRCRRRTPRSRIRGAGRPGFPRERQIERKPPMRPGPATARRRYRRRLRQAGERPRLRARARPRGTTPLASLARNRAACGIQLTRPPRRRAVAAPQSAHRATSARAVRGEDEEAASDRHVLLKMNDRIGISAAMEEPRGEQSETRRADRRNAPVNPPNATERPPPSSVMVTKGSSEGLTPN